jgi:hypothetical protein
MDMIGQRLFTGRVAVAQAALAFATRYADDQPGGHWWQCGSADICVFRCCGKTRVSFLCAPEALSFFPSAARILIPFSAIVSPMILTL